MRFHKLKGRRHVASGMKSCLIGIIFIAHVSSLQAAQKDPQRIITLSPHLAELVYSLGSGEQLIGVIEHSDYPKPVRDIARIGSASGIDMERILSLKPDLILAWQGGSRDADIRRLKEHGLRVVSIKSESLEDIPGSLKILGELLNQQHRSSMRITAFNKHLKIISDKYRKQTAHKIFIEISSQPLMGLTNRHPFSTGLELCGLKNIFADINREAIVADLESVLGRDVGIVLLRQKAASNEFAVREKFYQISDDSTISFVGFDEDTAFRQTPRLLDAVDDVCSTVTGLNKVSK